MEEWRPVSGYEGQYEISSAGRVRSLERFVKARDRWGGEYDRHIRPRILKGGPHKGGYTLVRLGRNQKAFTVHRLVMEAFVGPRSEGEQIRHLDGNPRNNALSNLSYGTAADNAADSKMHGTFQQRIRKNCKILPEHREVISALYASGMFTMREIGEIFGTTLSAIWWVIRRSDETAYRF